MTQIDAEQKPVTKRGFIRTWLLAQLAFLVVAAVWVAFFTMLGKGYSVTHFALFGMGVFPPASLLALWGVRAASGGMIAKSIFGTFSVAAIIGAVCFSHIDAVLMASVVWLVTAVPFFLISSLVKLIKEKEEDFARRRAQRSLSAAHIEDDSDDEYEWLNKHIAAHERYLNDVCIHECDPTYPVRPFDPLQSHP
jgi:hypothetical protein